MAQVPDLLEQPAGLFVATRSREGQQAAKLVFQFGAAQRITRVAPGLIDAALQAAPLRLIEVLKRVQDDSQRIHLELMREARDSEPAKRQAGRPAGSRNRAKPHQIEPGDAPAAQEAPEVPEWLKNAV